MKKVEKLYLLNMIGSTSLLILGIITTISNLLQNNCQYLVGSGFFLVIGLAWMIFLFVEGEEK